MFKKQKFPTKPFKKTDKFSIFKLMHIPDIDSVLKLIFTVLLNIELFVRVYYCTKVYQIYGFVFTIPSVIKLKQCMCAFCVASFVCILNKHNYSFLCTDSIL